MSGTLKASLHGEPRPDETRYGHCAQGRRVREKRSAGGTGSTSETLAAAVWGTEANLPCLSISAFLRLFPTAVQLAGKRHPTKPTTMFQFSGTLSSFWFYTALAARRGIPDPHPRQPQPSTVSRHPSLPIFEAQVSVPLAHHGPPFFSVSPDPRVS